MVSQNWRCRRIADFRNVYSDPIIYDHNAGGLCSELRRRFPHASIWLSLSVRGRKARNQRCDYDGGGTDHSCGQRKKINGELPQIGSPFLYKNGFLCQYWIFVPVGEYSDIETWL